MIISGIAKTRQVYIDGQELYPEYSQRWRNHSPDGFSWGFFGSGPSQLALAIMLEYCINHDDAIKLYQKFKEEIISKLTINKDFSFDIDINNWIKNNLNKKETGNEET